MFTCIFCTFDWHIEALKEESYFVYNFLYCFNLASAVLFSLYFWFVFTQSTAYQKHFHSSEKRNLLHCKSISIARSQQFVPLNTNDVNMLVKICVYCVDSTLKMKSKITAGYNESRFADYQSQQNSTMDLIYHLSTCTRCLLVGAPLVLALNWIWRVVNI